MPTMKIILAIMFVFSASTFAGKGESSGEKESDSPIISEIKFDFMNNDGRQPYSARTSVLFKLNKDCKVKVEFFSITGQSVDIAENSYLKAGNHRVFLETSDICSGIYWLLISTPDTSLVRKMTLLK
jgi:hypothetical protein